MQIMTDLTEKFSGPLLFDYVWWILKEAVLRNVDTIYFLARDGYLLHKIALRFCEVFNLNIKCKYLYCSRASLRMPTYHFINDEAIDILLLGGYRITLDLLMKRAELTLLQRKEVYQECGFSLEDEHRILNKLDFNEVCHKLRNSSTYRKFIVKNSKESYSSAIGYLKQEGLLDLKTVAIADSGWTGSMQRSIRQLLESQGFSGEIVGFYFGMYAPPISRNDGTYLTWYFKHSSSPTIKIPFSNNLFECLLAAPHGMTLRYIYQDGKYSPVLSSYSDKEKKLAQAHIMEVLCFVDEHLLNIKFQEYNTRKRLFCARRLIRRYMAHPKRDEAVYYGQYLFCDDSTESYKYSLASLEQIDILKSYLIPIRIFKRFLTRETGCVPSLFWTYGTIALLPRWKQGWYRLNIYIWEWLRYVLS